MTEIYGIQLLLQVRERSNQKVLIEQQVIVMFPNGVRSLTGWGPVDKHKLFNLEADVRTLVVDKLCSHDVHTRQKVGTDKYSALKDKSWCCDSCVLEVKDFETVPQLESWYNKNTTSTFDQFLNRYFI